MTWSELSERNFNCTIQELKWNGAVLALRAKVNFNCTIQELKYIWIVEGYVDLFLFQLHHTGIKIAEQEVHKLTQAKFQLHHTGIKIGRYSCSCLHDHQISIAPYRN